MSELRVFKDEYIARGVGLEDLYSWIYSEINPPWAYESELDFRAHWPAGIVVVPLSGSTGTSFLNRVTATLSAHPGQRIVIQLEEAVYHLTTFNTAGSSGRIDYAFGLWAGPNLQGFVGRGADKTVIQLDANSMTTIQVNYLSTLRAVDFEPNAMGFMRLDGGLNDPVILAGITFQAADQNMMTSAYPDVRVKLPQPAPHNGVVIYSGSDSIVSYCRFLAAGRGMTSAPPFEHANLGSQYGNHIWNNCEFDGRRAKTIDPLQPRRCGPLMVNNENSHVLTDSWFHHSNISRYACNDQNRDTQGHYEVSNVQAEHVTDNQNTDPALGGSLGGFTNATPFGWESINGTIEVKHSKIFQSNSKSEGQVPMHFQLTSVGSRNPQGGVFTATDNEYLWPRFPWLNGFCGFRIMASTYWWTDGFQNTIYVIQEGVRLSPHIVTGTWPPTSLPAGVTPKTHYLIRAA